MVLKLYFTIFIFVIITSNSIANKLDFPVWLDKFKVRAEKSGISRKTIEESLSKAEILPRVIEFDKNQPEFTLTLSQYLKNVVSNKRKKKGISSNIKDFGTTMIVCKMKHKKKHNNIAYEFFHYSQTIAILPLKGGVSSVVITLPSSVSKDLLSMNKNNFNKNIF